LPGNEIDHKRILDKRGSHTFIDMIASRLALFDNETTKHLITRVKDRLLIGGGETERIWIITEAGRSVTTLLLREEYWPRLKDGTIKADPIIEDTSMAQHIVFNPPILM
jgi:hypothetical protein